MYHTYIPTFQLTCAHATKHCRNTESILSRFKFHSTYFRPISLHIHAPDARMIRHDARSPSVHICTCGKRLTQVHSDLESDRGCVNTRKSGYLGPLPHNGGTRAALLGHTSPSASFIYTLYILNTLNAKARVTHPRPCPSAYTEQRLPPPLLSTSVAYQRHPADRAMAERPRPRARDAQPRAT